MSFKIDGKQMQEADLWFPRLEGFLVPKPTRPLCGCAHMRAFTHTHRQTCVHAHTYTHTYTLCVHLQISGHAGGQS